MPQVWSHPALTETNRPTGGVDCPSASAPQHSTAPVLRIPQVCEAPALTDSNRPAGGVDCPRSSRPQHSTAPVSRRRPQV